MDRPGWGPFPLRVVGEVIVRCPSGLLPPKRAPRLYEIRYGALVDGVTSNPAIIANARRRGATVTEVRRG